MANRNTDASTRFQRSTSSQIGGSSFRDAMGTVGPTAAWRCATAADGARALDEALERLWIRTAVNTGGQLR